MLGNVDLFTHRLLTVKHRIYKQQKLEEKLLAELEKEYGLNIDLDGLVKAQQRRGLIDLTASMRPSKRQKLPMQAVDIANVKGMAAAAVPHGAAWDITFPDPMTLFADLKKRSVTKEDDNSNSKNNANDSADSSVNSGEGAATATAVVTSDEASTNSGGGSSNSDESSSSGSSNSVAVSVAGATDSDQPPSQTSPPASKLAPVSSAALARQKPKPHPFSIESLRAASSHLSPVALAERAATNYDDIDRMRAILSHLQRRSGLLEQQRANRLMAGGRLGGSKNAKPKKKRYHYAQPQAPRLLPPTPGIVLAPGVGFLPQKSEMIQAQNAAFTKHTSGRGRKGQVALRASTQDGSPAVHVQKFADKGVASEIEIMNNRLIPWSHIVAKFTDLTAADMSSLAAAAAQSASMSGRSEAAMALRRRKSTTVPVPRWNLVEEMEGGIDVEEDESMLQDRVYEKRHVAHLAEMQMAFEKARAEQEQKKREKVAARQSAAIANRNNRVAGRGSPRASPMRSRFGQSPMAGPAASKKRKRVISEIGLPPSRVVAGAGAAGSLSKGAGLASSMSPPAAQGRGTRPKATRNTTKAKKERVTRRSAAAASASPLPVRASKRSKRGRGRQ